MVKLPTSLGPLDVPQSRRGVASYDVSSVRSGMLGAARSINAGLDDVSGGLNALAVKAEQVQGEDDRRHAVELENEFAKRIAAIQYGDGTETNPGYFNLQGEDAVKGYAGTEQSIEKAKQELLMKAGNKRVKEMFSLSANGRQVTETEQMRSHVGKARLDAANTASETRFVTAVDDAIAAPGNEEILNRSIAIVENEAIAMGKRNGWNNETTARKIMEARTAVYSGVVNAAMVNDPTAADAIYQKYKNRITGSERAKLENSLLTQTIDARAQSIAEEAWTQADDLQGRLAWIRANKEGKEEEAAIAELKERYQELDYLDDKRWEATSRAMTITNFKDSQAAKAKTEASEAAADKAWAAITGGQGFAKWAAENPSDFNAMDYYTYGKMETAERNFLLGKEYGDITDPKYLEDLYKLPPGEVVKKQLYLDKKMFGNQNDYEEALHFQKAQADRINSESNNAATYRRMEYIFKDVAPKTGKIGSQKIDLDDTQMNAAIGQGTDEVLSYIEKEGKAPDEKFMRELAIKLMMPIYKSQAAWWDTKKGIVGNLGNLPNEDIAKIVVDIDDLRTRNVGMLNDITFTLKTAGLDATDEDLIENLAGATVTGNLERVKEILGADGFAKVQAELAKRNKRSGR